MRVRFALAAIAALVGAALVPALAGASPRSHEDVMCRVSNTLTMNPAPLVNNGLTAPFPGSIYDMAAVPVPPGARVVSEDVTAQYGATPSATALPNETWETVYKGRPDSKYNFGLTPFKNPWGVVLKVSGTSTTQPKETPTWHLAVVYELNTASSCPKGEAGPQATEVITPAKHAAKNPADRSLMAFLQSLKQLEADLNTAASALKSGGLSRSQIDRINASWLNVVGSRFIGQSRPTSVVRASFRKAFSAVPSSPAAGTAYVRLASRYVYPLRLEVSKLMAKFEPQGGSDGEDG